MKHKNNVITYTVNKVANTGLYISVQNGEVIVKAPWYFSNHQIQRVVEEKKQWILQKLQEYEETDQKSFDFVRILGQNYELRISYKLVKIPMLDIEGRQIKVVLPMKYKKIGNKEIIEILLQKMYRMIAEKELEKIMEKTRLMVGMAPEDYEIKELKGILATCSEEKKITIDPKIVKYGRETIEYVVLHEFCHLQYKIHSKGFKKMLKTYMPDYRYYEKVLEKRFL